MICPKCGTENTESNKYCRACGEFMIEDIVSDSGNYDEDGAAVESTKEYTKRSVESTKTFRPKKGQFVKRRHRTEQINSEQPKTGIPRSYSPPRRAMNTYGESAAYDYNDHFDNNKYEKTGSVERQQYDYMQSVRRRKSVTNVPYLVVTYFTALISLLNFGLPFLDWIRFQYSVDMVGFKVDEKLNIIEIIQKLFAINDANEVFGDSVNNIMSWDVVPDFLGKGYDTLNAAFAFAKIAALIVFAFMAIALVLYLIFFLLAVFQRRSATGFGISAAIIMLLSCGGFVFSLMYISSQTDGIITLESAPYQALTLQVVMVILVSVMSVLRALSRRR